jgi:hypothetical protein
MDIHEGERKIVLVNDLGWDLFTDDFRKDRFGHGIPFFVTFSCIVTVLLIGKPGPTRIV